LSSDPAVSPWNAQPAGAVASPGVTARVAPWRSQAVCAVVSLTIFSQLLALGADTAVLAAGFAVLDIVAAAAVVVLLWAEPREALWRQIGLAGLFLAAALAWGVAPALLGAGTRLAPNGPGLEALKLLGVSALMLAGALIGASRARLRRLVYWLTLAGLAYTLAALWIGRAAPFTVWGQPKWAHMWRFTGSFLNANAAGCAFGMLGLLALGLARYRLSRTDLLRASLRDYLLIALAAAGALAAFGAGVMTQSRAALVLSLALGGLLVVFGGEGGGAGRRAGIGIGALLAVGVLLGLSQMGARPDSVAGDVASRAVAANHYLGLTLQRPWFGYGIGGFEGAHLATLTPATAPVLWDFGAAHDAALQAALEGGIPYLLLILAALAVTAWPLIRPGGSPRRRNPLAQAAAAASLLAAICSFGDIALNVPAVAALAALLWGAAWSNGVAAD
jgi:O-antigen ligase